MAYCKQCGKELTEGAKFCVECGTAVEAPAAPVEEKIEEVKEEAVEATETVKEETAEAAKMEPEIETVEEPKVVEAAVPEQAQNASSAAQSTQQTQSQQTQQQTYQQNQGQQQYQQTQPAYDPRKSRTLAGILGIIFGSLGVHNFYLGYTSKAVIQLCVTILGLVLCCLGIGVFIVTGIAIWGLVEGIMILAGSINVDGKGVPLRD